VTSHRGVLLPFRHAALALCHAQHPKTVRIPLRREKSGQFRRDMRHVLFTPNDNVLQASCAVCELLVNYVEITRKSGVGKRNYKLSSQL
jgi:hypothetical protein